MPKKIRVYELAKELGLTNKEGLELALSLGIGVKSHSSSIEDAQADRVRRKADAEGLRRPVQPEEPAPAKKAAKATKAAKSAAPHGGRGRRRRRRGAGAATAHLGIEQLGRRAALRSRRLRPARCRPRPRPRRRPADGPAAGRAPRPARLA